MQTKKNSRLGYKELALSRVGTTKTNNENSLMVVDTYNNSMDVIVRFVESGYKVKTNWAAFVGGNVKDVYAKSKFNVGYYGDGKHKSWINGKHNPVYIAWNNMLSRAYSQDFIEKNPSYRGTKVTEEWLCFQNFADWYEENYYHIEDQRMDLDKDILIKGNKLYSADTCVFVPQEINKLFMKRKAMRGETPIGVKISANGKKYEARSNGRKNNGGYIGVYDTVEEAFAAYKNYKENKIKEYAEKYKGQIPDKLYSAMMEYQVEITD